ncbi:5-dehydro-4-deoxyglucarate dehydratase [Curtobacterium sp. S6]|uniref:5-dehydro-4-deoxyglucarate dehydratase n=1 Tax=Curtobacterium sp. S6 TaxID=1479623 RepID=UPI0004AB07B6|nr:5-dehydro-4-deoxyglucarate dehydratase [Curtobacterium sp. S6]
MARFSPRELAAHLKDGLLSFPVTAFRTDGELDEAAYRQHIEWQSAHGVTGLFAAGGTGEGFSLTPAENATVTGWAVAASNPEVPVLGSASGSTRQAVECARGAEAAGAEGILLLPPYLTECSQQGLLEHASAVCESVGIAVIAYNRANAIYSAETIAALAERHPNFVGFKDAVGDIEHLAKVTALNGDRLFYLGGLPTAETYALPLLQMGMSTYSSAIFNFAPEFALDFYRDVRRQDGAAVQEKLRRFILPYLEIRDRGRGYGVSIIKAGLRAVGRDAGPVRPPLNDLPAADFDDLKRLIETSGIAKTLTKGATR